jgi:hypothetical protein
MWIEEVSDRLSLAITALADDFSSKAIADFNNLIAARDELIDLAYERATGKRVSGELALRSAARAFGRQRL